MRSLLVIAMILFSSTAVAREPSQIFGRWVEKNEHGSVFREYKPSEVVLSRVGADGKLLEPPQTFRISYQILGETEGAQTFGVNFLNEDGTDGGGIMVLVKDEDHIIEIYPGAGGTALERVK